VGAALIALALAWHRLAEHPGAGAPSLQPFVLRATWSPKELYGPCRVTRVVDGDTVDVACAGQRTRVRLLNVDTPERGQRGFARAGAALRKLIGDHPIFLLFETPGQPSWGRYGRLLAYLISEDGTNLNLALIAEGWSPFYRKYGDGRFPRQFARAAAEARQQGMGLWGGR